MLDLHEETHSYSIKTKLSHYKPLTQTYSLSPNFKIWSPRFSRAEVSNWGSGFNLPDGGCSESTALGGACVWLQISGVSEVELGLGLRW